MYGDVDWWKYLGVATYAANSCNHSVRVGAWKTDVESIVRKIPRII